MKVKKDIEDQLVKISAFSDDLTVAQREEASCPRSQSQETCDKCLRMVKHGEGQVTTSECSKVRG